MSISDNNPEDQQTDPIPTENDPAADAEMSELTPAAEEVRIAAPTSPTEPPARIVINRRSVYEPEIWKQPLEFAGKMPNPQDDPRRYLFVLPKAFEKLHESLDWGRRTRRNTVEQGGVLVGTAATWRNEIYCFVHDVIIANTAGSAVFVEFTTDMWSEMQDELSALNEDVDPEKRHVIVGWFHTHPNGLQVFMSGTDTTTQRLNFSQEWQASLVMNPHTDSRRVFFGHDITEGKVILPTAVKTERLTKPRGG